MAKNIIVVDDDPDDRGTMQTILEKNKYNVTAVDDGEKAISLIQKKKFDLVLLNIIMPKLSGFDVLKILRKEANPKLKIVFVSIMPEKEVYHDNIDGFIQKPFSPRTFLAKIKGVLK